MRVSRDWIFLEKVGPVVMDMGAAMIALATLIRFLVVYAMMVVASIHLKKHAMETLIIIVTMMLLKQVKFAIVQSLEIIGKIQ